MKETSETISEWAQATFGPVKSNFRSGTRANEEMSELLSALAEGKTGPEIVNECADVTIVLSQLAWINGQDLFKAVDEKMKTNRARKWQTDGSGFGQHLEQEDPNRTNLNPLPEHYKDID